MMAKKLDLTDHERDVAKRYGEKLVASILRASRAFNNKYARFILDSAKEYDLAMTIWKYNAQEVDRWVDEADSDEGRRLRRIAVNGAKNEAVVKKRK